MFLDLKALGESSMTLYGGVNESRFLLDTIYYTVAYIFHQISNL